MNICFFTLYTYASLCQSLSRGHPRQAVGHFSHLFQRDDPVVPDDYYASRNKSSDNNTEENTSSQPKKPASRGRRKSTGRAHSDSIDDSEAVNNKSFTKKNTNDKNRNKSSHNLISAASPEPDASFSSEPEDGRRKKRSSSTKRTSQHHGDSDLGNSPSEAVSILMSLPSSPMLSAPAPRRMSKAGRALGLSGSIDQQVTYPSLLGTTVAHFINYSLIYLGFIC